jgi:PAS domain S-box-containing protein
MSSPPSGIADSSVANIASGTGWILLALGLIVLSGWAFKVSVLTSLGPGLATMKPNTAAAFMLAGLALIRGNQADHVYYSIGVFTIGVVTLIEYLSNDFGVDQLLFHDLESPIYPGRMSQVTSVGFTVLGPALAQMNARSEISRRTSRSLGLLAGSLGFIALLGYSYDTRALYQVRPYTSVALHIAVAFLIASLGVQCANSTEGIVCRIRGNSTGGAMLRQLLPAALLVPYLFGFAVWVAHKHLGWEMGFALALFVAATMSCLVTVMLLNARHLDKEELARRERNRELQERASLLQVKEQLLRTFVKHVPAAIAMLDRDMRYVQVSERWCADYSLDSSQIVGPSHYEILPDIPEQWRQFHVRGLAGETLRAEEDRWDRAQGGTTWVRCEIRPWGSRQRLPEGILIFSEDITERKLAQQALQESRQRLTGLVQPAMDAIIAIDIDMEHRIFLFNPAAENIFGCPAADAIGSSINRFIPERFRAQYGTHIRCFAETGVTSRSMGNFGVPWACAQMAENFLSRPPFPRQPLAAQSCLP